MFQLFCHFVRRLGEPVIVIVDFVTMGHHEYGREDRSKVSRSGGPWATLRFNLLAYEDLEVVRLINQTARTGLGFRLHDMPKLLDTRAVTHYRVDHLAL